MWLCYLHYHCGALCMINFAACLQASSACFEPKPAPAKASSFQPEHLHASTFRVPVPEERPPHLWSREEAYLRTGVWSSAVAYEPGALGGACRELPLFAADGKKKSKEGLEDACTKKQYSRGALSPGLEVRCVHTVRAKLYHVTPMHLPARTSRTRATHRCSFVAYSCAGGVVFSLPRCGSMGAHGRL